MTSIYSKMNLNSKREFLPFCAFAKKELTEQWNEFMNQFLLAPKIKLAASKKRTNKQWKKQMQSKVMEERTDFNDMVDDLFDAPLSESLA